jgi:hypothetical protein
MQQGLQLTLGLLPSPSKALVASALAGVAADLALSSGNPAHCLAYRPAYDEQAFQVRAAAGWRTPAVAGARRLDAPAAAAAAACRCSTPVVPPLFPCPLSRACTEIPCKSR